MASAKRTYKFSEGNRFMKNLLGGKGANLAEMTISGLPVPPGFTITTEACNEYIGAGRHLPPGLEDEIREHMQELERATGRSFGDPRNPLLVSVRSGARASMPGMMDTVLNLGLNAKTLKGLIAGTGDERFAYDAYRRFVTMFGDVVLSVDRMKFDRILDAIKKEEGVEDDPQVSAAGMKKAAEQMKALVEKETGKPFPEDPYEQLMLAVRAVFDSWEGERAHRYRVIHKIPHDWGTAVNVQTMVFGNMGDDCGTGVAFTRNAATGDSDLMADYLPNAQGEDVVGGERTPVGIDVMEEQMPTVADQLEHICDWLEKRYGDMQDLEFTVEHGKLWMLQTRNGKRTGSAALKIAVDMVDEGLITSRAAIMQVEPASLDQILHPQFEAEAKPKAVATGVNASPGAASGRVVFESDEARELVLGARQNRDKGWDRVILVRHKTEPDDVGGMEVSQGILTAIGGRTSHAAVVARQMGKCCVAGCKAIEIDYEKQQFTVNGHVIKKGDYISLDGTLGEVMLGDIPTRESDVLAAVRGDKKAQKSPLYQYFNRFMSWVDAARRLGVRANADDPANAALARALGAQGIGLCRTEHMFFQEDRIRLFQRMILADDVADRKKALAELLPFQRSDFEGILEAMDGLPVIIRLLDPPLHEFLPAEQPEEGREEEWEATMSELSKLTGKSREELVSGIRRMEEGNPMLGHRGCRLGVTFPEISEMQARAIFEAACNLKAKGRNPMPEVMIPVVALSGEIEKLKRITIRVADEVMAEKGVHVEYMVGTMIELPRACLVADEIAQHAQFFSFGTNDLTQTTYGFSRDDVEGRFFEQYINEGIMPNSPFDTIDRAGVGALVRMATERGRNVNPDLEVGICGEHGGEPQSVVFCHEVGMDYVSCSPLRIPIARVAAAQGAITQQGTGH
jgi:pyruvate,orthophosphate dikinase